MKKYYSQLILLSAFLTIATLLFACKKERHESYTDLGTMVFTGNATAAQAIPAKTNNGAAIFKGYFDQNNKVFNYTVNWSKLDSTATSISFYGPYSTSQPYVLLRTPVTFATPLPTGNAGSTSYAISQLTALSDFDVENLKNGSWYFVVNTTASPAGAVRGQITYVKTFFENQ